MILLVGSEGSMGKRYQAILRYLGKGVICTDIQCPKEALWNYAERCSGIIIATPTDTHADKIWELLRFQKPILCEKPITKNIKELKTLFEDIRDADVKFHMMYQYKNLIHQGWEGVSKYNYFRHGNDGLIWDCLQIIGLSEETPELAEDSPVWKCQINGQRLNSKYMDEAYITSVIDFLDGRTQDLGHILAAHEKTWEMANQ